MKKLIIIAIFLIATTTNYAQSFFNTLEDMDGVDMVVVTKDAFEMLSKFENVKNNETMQVFSMIKDLNELKVFSTDQKSLANKMDEMVGKAVKVQKLTELMRVKDDDSRVKIYVKTTKNKNLVSEVLMFVKDLDKKTKGNTSSVIVSLTGSIDINKMSELADAYIK